MKLVTQDVYTQFVQDLINVEGWEVDGAIESVVQTIDEDGVVRAQVIFFNEGSEPQYMIDKRVAWTAAVRAAQLATSERAAIAGAFLPEPKGISIDD